MTTNGDRTFVKITNHDIWLKLEEMNIKLDKACSSASKAKWIASVAFGLFFCLFEVLTLARYSGWGQCIGGYLS